MIHLMIDGETPDTATTTSFLTLAAVPFTVEEGILSKEHCFYERASLDSLKTYGFTVAPGTLGWWELQDKVAYNEAFGGTDSISVMLEKFCEYCIGLKNLLDNQEIAVWGNGATFDNVILRNSLQKLKFIVPWSYRNDYCYRTLKNLFSELTHTYTGTKHNALDDAYNQAQHAIKILQRIESMKAKV